MHDNGHVSSLATTLLTIGLTAAFVFPLYSPLAFTQYVYSQMANNAGFQNLSALFKNFLMPQKDVSGHFSNPQFGIVDIVFPNGWHGRELAPIFGLTVIMHPGIENRSSFFLSTPLAQPQMLLQVRNNSELAGVSSGGSPQDLSISKICKPLTQNTTSVIDGKAFNVATVECPLSSIMGSALRSAPSIGISNQSNFAYNGGSGIFKSLNPNAVMQAKLYEFKGIDKTYRLGLVVSNLYTSPSQSSEKPDISKYTQLLDTTANTLKLR
ncbi:MAG TPA: hypothetical protein VFI73_10085 [Candidatus Nitrosopolaris sp.]|nr:hypothetical protein [Candidatus Nitrosopolaris sp.]